MASWIKPKMAHKQMVQRLLQVRAHLILCFRAEPKIEMVRGENGKLEIREKQSLTGLHGWIPVCEKSLPYELTASLLLMPDRPGVPQPIKLQEQHKALFPLDQPITEASGTQLAAWAKGAATPALVPAGAMPVADWLGKITDAATADDLEAIGRALKEASGNLNGTTLKVIRAAYAARMRHLKAQAVAP